MATLPTLRKGDDGSSVVYLQQRLSSKGYTLKADGDFGPTTDRVVRQFQAGAGLTADGVVGGRTWTALQVESVAKAPEELLEEMRASLAAKIPASTPDIVKKTLTLACADLGKKESPDGYNDGPDIHHLVKHYNQYWWVLRDGAKASAQARGYPSEDEVVAPLAWCGMAVTNWIRSGLELPYWDYTTYGKPIEAHPFKTFLGGAAQIENWAKKKGCWFKSKSSTAIPSGAVFTISRGRSGSDPSTSPSAGHIGLCVCDNGDGTITTIEGNVSNGVGSYSRKKSELRGYATWW